MYTGNYILQKTKGPITPISAMAYQGARLNLPLLVIVALIIRIMRLYVEK